MSPYLHILVPSADDGLAMALFNLMLVLWLAALFAAALIAARLAGTPDDKPAGASLPEIEAHLQALVPSQFPEAAPSLLIMIGLLGTFIGIAAAIVDAQEALQHSRSGGVQAAADQLSAMMGSIGLKFRTSAWGLIGSLTLRPFVQRLCVRGRSRRALQIWTARSEQRGRQIKTVVENVQVLGKLESVIQGLTAAAGQLTTSSTAIQTAATSLHSTLGQITQTVERAVRDSSQSTGQAMTQVSTALAETTSRTASALDRMGLTIDATMQTSLGRLEQATRRIEVSLADGQRALGAQIADGLERIVSSSNEAIAAFRADSGAALRELAAAQSATGKAMDERLEGLHSVLLKMAEEGRNLTRQTVKLTANAEGGFKVNGHLADSVDLFGERLTALFGQMQNALGMLKRIALKDMKAADTPDNS